MMQEGSDPLNVKKENNKDDLKDYYKILNVARNSTSQEIRAAYYRLKSTYVDSNQAMYSLLDSNYVTQKASEIEDAFNVLAQIDQRSKYDLVLIANGMGRNDEFISLRGDANPEGFAMRPQNMMTSYAKNGFTHTIPTIDKKILSSSGSQDGGTHPNSYSHTSYSGSTYSQATNPQQGNAAFLSRIRRVRQNDQEQTTQIEDLLNKFTPGDGGLLKAIRELLTISREEIQNHTKISMGYLIALEENQFERLPQLVYVKGFLKSYLTYLGIPNVDGCLNHFLEKIQNCHLNKAPSF